MNRLFVDSVKAPSITERSLSPTIFKYLVKDILFSFCVAFLFFFFVFFVNQLLLMAQEILAKRVPLYQVALLVFFALPAIVAMSTPFASLMGTLMTVGRLSSDNEILILLSSGLSYRMIFFPALMLGVLISIFSFIANDVLLPAGMIEFSRLYRRILLSTPALELEENSVTRFRDTVIVTGPVDGRVIRNILILDRTSDGERRVILATHAELTDGGDYGLSLDLTNAFIQSSKEMVRSDYDYATADFLRYWVATEDIIQAVAGISPNQMSSRDLWREIGVRRAALYERLDESYSNVLAKAVALEDSLRKGPSDFGAWNRRDTNLGSFLEEYRSARIVRNDRGLLLHRYEFNKKFAIPFGALSFVLLAVSLGLMAKKSGQTVGFILGIIISFIYWSLLIGGQTIGIRMGFSAFWTMWLPNILSFSIGLILLVLRIRK